MKPRFNILFIVICFWSNHLRAQTISLVFSPNPSPYISDWASRSNTAQLVINNPGTADIQVKIKGEMFDNSGILVANTVLSKVPVLTVEPGVHSYGPEEIIPLSAVNYNGKLAASTIKTGKISSGDYRFCVSLVHPKTGAPVGSSGTVCKTFSITDYQAPVLISPANKASVSATGLLFKWGPVNPTPKEAVTYVWEVYELLPGQSNLVALKTNQSLVSKELNGAMQTSWPTDMALPEAGKSYVWTVTPVNAEGQKLVEGNGFAEPFSFTIKSMDTRKLILLTPVDNATVKDVKSIGDFTWQLEGVPIHNPQFTLEIELKDLNGKSKRKFSAKTGDKRLASTVVFKDFKLDDGRYFWRVKESTSGIGSEWRSFTTTYVCPSDTILVDSAICPVQGSSAYRICLRNIWTSSTQTLQYTSAGSGLKAYDLSWNPLTISNITPALTPQSTASSMQYCFEVSVPSGINSIFVGIQGDELFSGTPFQCRPAAFDSVALPKCICTDCDSIQLDTSGFHFTPTTGGYTIAGNLNANVPIYGMEFQLQSFSWSANPTPCSNGVSVLEESGMFLVPSSTVNGNAPLLFNETASGSTTTNNGAAKIIRYNSSSAISGNIPLSLNVGLPGPLPGFNKDCCRMNYSVCIKVKVFYDEKNCKYCTFKYCFSFNNQ